MANVSAFMRHDMPLSTGAVALYPLDPKIIKTYRFNTRFEEEVLLYEQDGNQLKLPRALCPIGQQDLRIDGEKVNLEFKGELRPDQPEWFYPTAEFLKAGESGVVVAGTGRGKTALGYFAASVVKRKTLVVCTKSDIYEQWIAGAKKFLGLADHEIGQIRQDKCEIVGKKFVVAMIHSLSIEGKYPDSIAAGFGLVIFDECHRLPATNFVRVASMFPAKVRLGLSATIGRSDGKELLVYAHIGPVRVEAKGQLLVPKVLLYKSQWKCPRVMRQGKVQRIPHEHGKTMTIEKPMSTDASRNYLVASLMRDCYEKARKTVVFLSLLEHMKVLQEEAHRLGVPLEVMGIYGPAPSKKAQEARELVKVKPLILTTWGMMSEGTSIDWLDCCILAMPRSNVVQAVGRIRREYPEKKQPVVIDIQDPDSPVLDDYNQKRAWWYRSIGAQVITVSD